MERIFVAIDVETTGLEPGVDEIIEVAAVKFRGSEVLETMQRMVKPRHALPLKISRLTGITDADVADAPRFGEIAPELVRFLKSYPVVGHSVGFDLRMLAAQGLRLPQPAYDTFDLATLLMPHAPSYKLVSLSAALGIAHDEAHRAHSDADVARQVFLHLLGKIEALSIDELTTINRLTASLGNWPLRDLFVEIERDKAKRVFLDERRPDLTRMPGESQEPRSEPLKPTDDPRPLDVDVVRHFFATDGALGRAFDGYEQRSEQVKMAENVAQQFNKGGTLMVEAGTGTGKSLAYLVPAAIFAAQRGERVIVSTNTINLQDQLFFKDIPDLQRIMSTDQRPTTSDEQASHHSQLSLQNAELPFTAALLKGRRNYLCLKRYHELRRQEKSLAEEEIRTLLKVQLWMPGTTTGDKAELLLMDRENTAWGKINVTPETCTGPRCPHFKECYFFKARREAEAAHIVVVNHALMLADLATEANVLPPYDHLIIDEAHNLEDVATDQLSFSLDQARLLQFLDDLYVTGGINTVDGLFATLPKHFAGSSAEQDKVEKVNAIVQGVAPIIARARSSVYECFNYLTAFITREAEVSAYDPRLRLVPRVHKHPAWAEVERAWENLALQLTTISDGLGKLVSLLSELAHADLLDYDALLLHVQALHRFVTEVRVNAGHIILGDSDELITWLQFDKQREMITMHAAPLSVAELLQANLFSQKATTVLASATLNIDGQFAFIESRLGLEEADELHLDSPFNYEQQALVYIPQDVPEPNQPNYQRALEEALIALCTATEGRALVLFTANSALRQTYKAIQEPLEGHGIAVLGQGIDGSRRTLINRFKEFPRTVLLGTTSFWEGVDVVGDALSVLVIAKLPFSVPTDPIFAARSEGFKDAFHDFSVPQSILRFKQGFGRLIRSRTDRGIVAVLDKRLLSKKYGQTFLNSLPPTLVRTGPVKQLPVLAARFLNQTKTPDEHE